MRLMTCIAIAVFVYTFAGCTTIQTPATAQIDTILSDGTLSRIPAADRGKVKATLITAKAEIVKTTKERDSARKGAANNSEWALRGKIAAGASAGAGVIFIIMLFRRLLR